MFRGIDDDFVWYLSEGAKSNSSLRLSLLCLRSANDGDDGHCVLLIPKHKVKVPIRCNDTGVPLEIPRMLNKCLSQDDLSQALNQSSFTSLLYKIWSESLDFKTSLSVYLYPRVDLKESTIDDCVENLRVLFNSSGLNYSDLLDQLVHSSVSLESQIPQSLIDLREENRQPFIRDSLSSVTIPSHVKTSKKKDARSLGINREEAR